MPKAPLKSCTSRKHEQSPTQRDGATTRKVAQTAAAASDPSRWRASKLRRTDTIAKKYSGDSTVPPDLVGIPFKATETVVNGVNRPMYLYKEQGIERSFRSSRLLANKERMPQWLWTTVNRVLFAVDAGDEIAMALGGGRFARDEARERQMRAALAWAATYPPRPDLKLTSSECVDRVRAVLAEAPRAPKPGPDWGRDDIRGLIFHSSRHSSLRPELTDEYRWSSHYLEYLFCRD
uniref:Zn(2)-C6 fungal-type domain-containing protein n=1 Tax=Ganoderma boninense TaxID=34458 RepID=A0A5K1JWV9_9APHY|nr:Zn(2)-C6 fungal-type domain-containing protein [Ganoderma boninense]